VGITGCPKRTSGRTLSWCVSVSILSWANDSFFVQIASEPLTFEKGSLLTGCFGVIAAEFCSTADWMEVKVG
jgi:hypothetical protein